MQRPQFVARADDCYRSNSDDRNHHHRRAAVVPVRQSMLRRIVRGLVVVLVLYVALVGWILFRFEDVPAVATTTNKIVNDKPTITPDPLDQIPPLPPRLEKVRESIRSGTRVLRDAARDLAAPTQPKK